MNTNLLHVPMTKTVCTKCKSDKVGIVPREMLERPAIQTMDDMVNNMFILQPAIYYPTTWKCQDCGYSITR